MQTFSSLDEFEESDVLERTQHLNQIFANGLCELKQTGVIAKVRGEGMVFGIECNSVGGQEPAHVANAVVKRCYLGNDDNDGIHLLGPLAGCVLRVSPPMCMTDQQAEDSLRMLHRFIGDVGQQLQS